MVLAPLPPEAPCTFPAWPADLAAREVVIVDLETTGGSPSHDRVIEIAAVRVRDRRVCERWQTLVNPETPVPPFITGLTGLSTGLVARAPRFARVASDFRDFLGDGIIAAHNASFDLGFLRREFARLDRDFAPAGTLCTLKLARRLMPGLPSHSLEAMVRTLDLPSRRAHRALPDALAAAELLLRLVGQAVEQGLTDWEAIMQLVEGPKRPRGGAKYERGRVRELPTGPGVYLLKDDDENVLYVGKSVNVRNRVATHLRGKAEGQPRLRRHLRYVANVQAITTETEIEALLLESQLIKRYLPVGNSQQRDEVHYPFVRIDVASDYPRIELTRFPQEDDAVYIGPFRSARVIGHVVEYVRTVCGIRSCDRPALPDGHPCLLLDLKRCLGPCVGAVGPGDYRAAVDRALEMLQGDWEDITLGLEERMLKLADFEEFERAAELRDAVEQLRRLMRPQLRLADLAHFHAVVVTVVTAAGPGVRPHPGSELPKLRAMSGERPHPTPLPGGEGTVAKPSPSGEPADPIVASPAGRPADLDVASPTGRGRPSPARTGEGAPLSPARTGEGAAPEQAAVQVFCIRGGRLVRQARLEWPAERRRLGPLVRAAYRGEEPPTMTADAAAEATVVAGWLRQQQKRADTTVVEVDPAHPSVALAAIRADLKRRTAADAS
jgi:DNA polymerase-3 subunit epsilon